MISAHNLGFPRIGGARELKWALERYWRGEIPSAVLQTTASELRSRHWRLQADAGLDNVPVGDFSLYDQVLDHSLMFGVVPSRFGAAGDMPTLDTYFAMARGMAAKPDVGFASEMTKWFDTNYHYLVPEFEPELQFNLHADPLLQQVGEAQAMGLSAKPVVIGPLTYLWLGKVKRQACAKLDLLPDLVRVYARLFAQLKQAGVEWVQVDEPILALDLSAEWRQAFESAYTQLATQRPKLLLTTYFGDLREHLRLACHLPVDGLHLDLCRAPQQLLPAMDWLPSHKVLSLGVVDGRNIWRGDLTGLLDTLDPVAQQLGDRLWLAPSCSLLHVPIDCSAEHTIDPAIRGGLAFAVQKLEEVGLLKRALAEGHAAVEHELRAAEHAIAMRLAHPARLRPVVRERVAGVNDAMARRNTGYAQRRQVQRARLQLPLFPTTTIGSFPQTAEIRSARRNYKHGELPLAGYEDAMRQHIADTIRRQEALQLDVLVHGEAERTDMVEYFGEQLDGFVFTQQGWVQSYGSRCVKPPIIHGDVARPRAMTVEWARYAQSLTDQPVKGMLTGPVTILQWSFVRDDQPRSDTCQQIALALRDEVSDLERAGIAIIQIDEPALREGLPLRTSDWPAYLRWAVRCFRIASAGVDDATQIHTHMCYAEFNDIIDAIAQLDADVITIETARSDMELLEAFSGFAYPNEIGPGVYDIHSPAIPETGRMEGLMRKAAQSIPAERLWVNPDCGLKTRAWGEVEPALRNMVAAARRLRETAVN